MMILVSLDKDAFHFWSSNNLEWECIYISVQYQLIHDKFIKIIKMEKKGVQTLYM